MQPYPAQGKLGKVKFNRLAFVRSGWVNLGNSTLRDFGSSGYGWSRTAITYSSPTSASAYDLYFVPSSVNPSRSSSRWVGYPVRCLVYKFKKKEKLFTSSVAVGRI